MSIASVSKYVASLTENQQRYICALIDFMNGEYPQLTSKISFSMSMWLVGKKMSEEYVAVSTVKSHLSIYFSDKAFMNRLAEDPPACKKGKRCINISYSIEASLLAVEAGIRDFPENAILKGPHPDEQHRDDRLLRRVLQNLPRVSEHLQKLQDVMSGRLQRLEPSKVQDEKMLSC